jgi:hypothetical protein
MYQCFYKKWFATLWKFQLQYYGKIFCNFREKVLAKNTWTTIESWYKTFDSYKGMLEGTSSVSTGYFYRVKASYYAYCGSDYENIVNYSQTVTY